MRKFLLYSSALAVFGLSGGAAEAACIQTPTCSSLGYTSTSSCTGGTKCPFGNYWNCDSVNKITELTNKITELEKIIEEIKQNSSSNSDILSNCQVGDILYSDKSCDPNVIATKKPIGVVFDRANKLAIGLEESRKRWADDYFDVPGLSNITSSSAVTADWQGKNNTKVVLEYCKTNGKSCPAFEYVNSYKTEGTQAGDWYLPAMSELNAIYGNKDVLNITLGKIGGTKLEADYWSSSEYSNDDAWLLRFSGGDVYYDIKYYIYGYGRPVIDYGDWANSSAGDEEETPDYGTCQIGDILYSDKTCNPTLSDNKSPIGVVFDNTNNLAIGLYTNHYTYAVNSFIVSGVPAYENQSQAEADLNGKENTKKTIEYCNANGYSCPAFEYVNSYITAGTQAGDWYLPALGELKKIYTLSDTLNRTLLIIGGTELPKKIPTGELNYGHLSSTKYEDWGAWGLAFYYGDFIKFQNNYGYVPFVRPVINYGEWRGN